MRKNCLGAARHRRTQDIEQERQFKQNLIQISQYPTTFIMTTISLFDTRYLKLQNMF
jgi:hypothetical protein